MIKAFKNFSFWNVTLDLMEKVGSPTFSEACSETNQVLEQAQLFDKYLLELRLKIKKNEYYTRKDRMLSKRRKL
jgi:hypothetical protein